MQSLTEQYLEKQVEQHVENGEMITAIDPNGELYPIDKLDAHVRNVPHLAISVFLFYRDKLLLQQRAANKYHSGNLWANTCCSHPRWQESPNQCSRRRVREELGFDAELTYFGKIDYAADVGHSLYENESAFCYVGSVPENTSLTNFNPDEVRAVRWIDLEDLHEDVRSHPENYTQWIRIYVLKHFDLLRQAAQSHAHAAAV